MPINETWTGSNGAAWPAPWSGDGRTGSSTDIQSNKGRMRTGTNANYDNWVRRLHSHAAVSDCRINFRLEIPSTAEQYWGVTVRGSGTFLPGDFHQNSGFTFEYGMWGSVKQIAIVRFINGTRSQRTQSSLSINAGDVFENEVELLGNNIRWRVWKLGQTKPTNWTLAVADPNNPSGRIGLGGAGGEVAAQRTAFWDNLSMEEILSPTTPANFTAIALDQTRIALSWAAVENAVYQLERNEAVIAPEILGVNYEDTGLQANTEYKYRIRSMINGVASPWSAVQTITTTSAATFLEYIHGNLAPNTTVNYRVRALGENDTPGAWSSVQSATTLSDDPGVNDPPNAPSGLAAMFADKVITVSWGAVTNATGYNLRRDASVIASNITDTEFVDEEIFEKTTYEYRVQAVNANGESSWSQPVVITTPEEPREVISPPQNLTVTLFNWNTPALEWDSGGPEYDIERRVAGVEELIAVGYTITSIEDPGREPEKTHEYRVRSRQDDDVSDWTNWVSITTDEEPPGNVLSVSLRTPTEIATF